ncbi:hypothetical protein LOAG_15721 [Loa loa]|uniref:Uncharacterized protein n=1 Tax=Loa loa TaxID=7209 RepID=A0A1S0TF71_LOALO|nr:hypothetical protein LOAG_15721 [Loa loa]EFO12811.1 hypothetical protein LOAG_15721 [Loa loa]
MGTISALIVICCLIISAALTVIIILVTIPTEITHESNFPEIWINRKNILDDTKRIPYNLKNDLLQNLPVIGTTGATSTTTTTTTSTTTTIITTTTTAFASATLITNTTLVATTAINLITLPNTAKILKHTKFENDKLSYQSLISSTTIPIKIWKSNQNKSSQRRTTVNLSTNITVTRGKKVTLGNRRSATQIRHHSISNEVTPRNLRQNLATLMLHQHIEQLPLNDDNLAKNKGEREQVMQMTLLNEVTFPNDVKVVGLAIQHELLYVATNDGQIAMINPETGKQV